MSRFHQRRSLKFLLDENVDVRVGHALSNSGYTVTFCPKGIRDADVLALAEKNSLMVITNDADFAQLSLKTIRSSSGIIVLRIHPPNLLITVHSLEMLIIEHVGVIQGKCIVLNEHGYTIV